MLCLNSIRHHFLFWSLNLEFPSFLLFGRLSYDCYLVFLLRLHWWMFRLILGWSPCFVSTAGVCYLGIILIRVEFDDYCLLHYGCFRVEAYQGYHLVIQSIFEAELRTQADFRATKSHFRQDYKLHLTNQVNLVRLSNSPNQKNQGFNFVILIVLLALLAIWLHPFLKQGLNWINWNTNSLSLDWICCSENFDYDYYYSIEIPLLFNS